MLKVKLDFEFKENIIKFRGYFIILKVIRYFVTYRFEKILKDVNLAEKIERVLEIL